MNINKITFAFVFSILLHQNNYSDNLKCIKDWIPFSHYFGKSEPSRLNDSLRVSAFLSEDDFVLFESLSIKDFCIIETQPDTNQDIKKQNSVLSSQESLGIIRQYSCLINTNVVQSLALNQELLLKSLNLSKQQLINLNLSNINLNQANFNHTSLYGVNFNNANLHGVNFNNANLQRVSFNNANLSNALLNVNLTGVSFAGANLTGANLRGANLTQADLTGADLTGADLTGADLTGADLTAVNLTGANLTGAHLINTILVATDFINTNLTRANLKNLDLRHTKFGSINDTEVSLEEVIFAD